MTRPNLNLFRAAQDEALRMWPEGIHNQLGRWDGLTISAERAVEIQRSAFAMGAEWQATGAADPERVPPAEPDVRR